MEENKNSKNSKKEMPINEELLMSMMAGEVKPEGGVKKDAGGIPPAGENNAGENAGDKADGERTGGKRAAGEKTDSEGVAGERATGERAAGKPKEKEESRKKRGKLPTDYESLFLKSSDTTARYGKLVYIRTEYHERIAKIALMLTGGQVSLSAYIDNVLAQHFEAYQEEITELYNGKAGTLF